MNHPSNDEAYQQAIDKAREHSDPSVREQVQAIVDQKKRQHDERLARRTPGPTLATETYHALLHVGLVEEVK